MLLTSSNEKTKLVAKFNHEEKHFFVFFGEGMTHFCYKTKVHHNSQKFCPPLLAYIIFHSSLCLCLPLTLFSLSCLTHNPFLSRFFLSHSHTAQIQYCCKTDLPISVYLPSLLLLKHIRFSFMPICLSNCLSLSLSLLVSFSIFVFFVILVYWSFVCFHYFKFKWSLIYC